LLFLLSGVLLPSFGFGREMVAGNIFASAKYFKPKKER
jgi:hypothetical protein